MANRRYENETEKTRRGLLMKAYIELMNNDVCHDLEVGGFSRSGEMLNCYCAKYSRYHPNGQVALMYCCALYPTDTSMCWFKVSKD